MPERRTRREQRSRKRACGSSSSSAVAPRSRTSVASARTVRPRARSSHIASVSGVATPISRRSCDHDSSPRSKASRICREALEPCDHAAQALELAGGHARAARGRSRRGARSRVVMSAAREKPLARGDRARPAAGVLGRESSQIAVEHDAASWWLKPRPWPRGNEDADPERVHGRTIGEDRSVVKPSCFLVIACNRPENFSRDASASRGAGCRLRRRPVLRFCNRGVRRKGSPGPGR
jgi:hypothetical protein